jgi:GDP-L-fucose synthase
MHVDDMAQACLTVMDNFDEEGFVNAGTGQELSIKELALLVAKVVGFEGELAFDATKPDGTPRKLLDVAKLHSLGFRHQIGLEEGIGMAYEDFKLIAAKEALA